jgi:hypothetical protein
MGSEEYNQRLSEHRADSVKSYLTGHGISSMRLSTLGKGQSEPVADNDSAAGRQQNRRVEVVIRNRPPHRGEGAREGESPGLRSRHLGVRPIPAHTGSPGRHQHASAAHAQHRSWA